MPEESVRLQRYLARAGVASRRASEALIEAGRISVNGVVVTQLGCKVVPRADTVCFDGNPVIWHIDEKPVVLMLHKPAGYLSAMSDERGKTVAELLPVSLYPGLYPIGRLDKDTTGILLFTTDGALGNALLHPSHHVDKTYLVTVDGCISSKDCAHLERGVILDDGLTAPAQVVAVKQNKKQHTSQFMLTIHEGRKRQIKRMCSAVGHPVLSLHRESFGPIQLGSLPSGKYRELTESEYNAISVITQTLSDNMNNE